MKRAAAVLLTILLFIPWTSAAPPTSVFFDYDFNVKQENRACSSTVTTACVNSFTVDFLSTSASGVTTSVGSPQTVALPATISATASTALACNNCVPTLTYPGQYSVRVATNYRDSSGTLRVSSKMHIAPFGEPDAVMNLRVQ